MRRMPYSTSFSPFMTLRIPSDASCTLNECRLPGSTNDPIRAGLRDPVMNPRTPAESWASVYRSWACAASNRHSSRAYRRLSTPRPRATALVALVVP